MYRARVLGEFPEQSEISVYSLAWIEKPSQSLRRYRTMGSYGSFRLGSTWPDLAKTRQVNWPVSATVTRQRAGVEIESKEDAKKRGQSSLRERQGGSLLVLTGVARPIGRRRWCSRMCRWFVLVARVGEVIIAQRAWSALDVTSAPISLTRVSSLLN
jgi:hypothetical protein